VRIQKAGTTGARTAFIGIGFGPFGGTKRVLRAIVEPSSRPRRLPDISSRQTRRLFVRFREFREIAVRAVRYAGNKRGK